uniref:Uncharacterized protein n=1 Tax=Caenorhabditis japonica TaxID=281687 RepID=A0A8R1ITW2_CAEJA
MSARRIANRLRYRNSNDQFLKVDVDELNNGSEFQEHYVSPMQQLDEAIDLLCEVAQIDEDEWIEILMSCHQSNSLPPTPEPLIQIPHECSLSSFELTKLVYLSNESLVLPIPDLPIKTLVREEKSANSMIDDLVQSLLEIAAVPDDGFDQIKENTRQAKFQLTTNSNSNNTQKPSTFNVSALKKRFERSSTFRIPFFSNNAKRRRNKTVVVGESINHSG